MVRSPTISYDGALLFVWSFVFVVVAVVVVVFLHNAFVSCYDSSLFWPVYCAFYF